MEQILTLFTTGLQLLLDHLVLPLFTGAGSLLELLIVEPMRLLELPEAIQVALVSILTALLSLSLRRVLQVEKKENQFKHDFAKQKEAQENLKLIEDWKSRETFAKAIDDDIDADFNTYLAGRFSRHGIIYLLPIFLTLYWLDTTVVSDRFVIFLPPNSLGIPGLSTQLVFLLFYCTTLIGFFQIRKRVGKTQPVHRQERSLPSASKPPKSHAEKPAATL